MMLIDAYNIINMDAELQAYLQSAGNLSFARAELEKRVQLFATASGANCVIVYDAMGHRNSGQRINR